MKHQRCATALCAAVLFTTSASLPAQDFDRTVLPIPPQPFRGRIARSVKTSTQSLSKPVRAPKGAPNVLLVLIDDAGYGQTSTFGGIIPTPTIDALANNGLRYTHFGVAALCSPTRASLLTGRNNHAVGMGTLTNWSNGFPGYTGSIPRSATMLPEILRANGYSTACLGKWHLIPDEEITDAGPFDHWPTHQGCSEYYGYLGGETNQWFPQLVEGTTAVSMVVPPGHSAQEYILNDALADHARDWIMKQKGIDPDKPLFLYFAPGGTHAPLQAPTEWIERFRGKFDMGWDVYREQTLERQKTLGVVPQDTVLTPRPPEIPAWDSLSPDEKKVASRLMEVFAGMMAQTDYEIGRVLDAFRDSGQLDNTMVILIAGDNGASLEGGLKGTDNLPAAVNNIDVPASEIVKRLDRLGGPDTEPHYPVGWAWAGNTPFQWGKRIGSHLGGTRDPMVISWPGHIRKPGGIRTQFTHVIDILPTILEAAGLPQPKSVDGVAQQPVDGISLLYTLNAPNAPERHTIQYSEMMGNVSIYDHGWIAADRSGLLPWEFKTDFQAPPWELYDSHQDYSEAHDLAIAKPDKLKQLQAVFDTEARRYKVYPIDPSIVGRNHHPSGPPAGSDHFTYYGGGTGHLPNGVSPVTINRSHTITAKIDVPASGAEGVIVADGGKFAGYSLYLDQSRPTYVYRSFQDPPVTIAARDALKPGPATITLQFDYDGGGLGKGATITLSVNGIKQASARLNTTVPVVYSYEEAFDVGEDEFTPVGPYASPFRFSGKLISVELKSAQATDENTNEQATERARQMTQ